MDLLPKFVDDAASPPAKAVGQTMADIWNLAFGNHVSLWIKKQEIRQEYNLKNYIEKIEEKTQQIPENFIQEPEIHIIGPALEASKYYINEAELRDMFANLIASSVDSRKSDKTHPSFVEIIKQLSPQDAQILKSFQTSSRIAIVKINLKTKDDSSMLFQNHVANIPIQSNFKSQAVSFSNLDRLGLLNIDYTQFLVDERAYAFANQHLAFERAEEALLEHQDAYDKVDIQNGIAERTPLCDDFINVCL